MFFFLQAYSTFSCGIVEKRNMTIKDILSKVKQDMPEVRIYTSYTVHITNILSDNKGFSPHQRVFGKNPHLPVADPEFPTSLNTTFENDNIRIHLNLLNPTRKAYMSVECGDRLKRP